MAGDVQVQSLFSRLGLKIDKAQWAKGNKALKDLEGRFQDAAGRWRASNGRFLTESERLAKGLENVGKRGASSLDKLEKKFSRVAAVGGAAIGVAAGLGLKKAVDFSDTYTGLENRLRQVTEGQDELNAIMDRTRGIANATRGDWAATGESFVKITKATKSLGVSQDRALALTETLNMAVASSGAPAESAAAAMMQLGQALGKGKLDGEEFNSVAENMSDLLDVLAKGMGVPRGKLKDLAAEGKITSKVIVASLEKAAPSIRETFTKSTATASQQWTVFKNNLMLASGEFIRSSGLVDALGRGMQKLTAWVERNRAAIREFGAQVGRVLTKVGSGIAAAFGWLVEHKDSVISVLKGVGLGLGLIAAKAVFLRVVALAPLALQFAKFTAVVAIFEKLQDKIGTVGAALAAAFALGGINKLIGSVGTLITKLVQAAAEARTLAVAQQVGGGGGGLIGGAKNLAKKVWDGGGKTLLARGGLYGAIAAGGYGTYKMIDYGLSNYSSLGDRTTTSLDSGGKARFSNGDLADPDAQGREQAARARAIRASEIASAPYFPMATGASSRTSNTTNNVNVTVNVPTGDPNAIANAVDERIGWMLEGAEDGQ